MWIDGASPKSHRQPNKIPSSRHEKPPFKVLVMETQKISKTIQAIAAAPGASCRLKVSPHW